MKVYSSASHGQWLRGAQFQQTAAPSQGTGELQVALDGGRRCKTEQAVTARALLKCSWASHPPTRKERVERSLWLLQGWGQETAKQSDPAALKEITRPFKPTEILNIVYALKDSKIKFSSWGLGSVSSKTKSVKFLMRYFTLLCTCSSHIQRETTSPSPNLPEEQRVRAGSRAPSTSSPWGSTHSLTLHFTSQKSANPWRSLVFWWNSSVPRHWHHSTNIQAEGIPKGCRSFGWVCQGSGFFGFMHFCWMLLQLPPPAVSHLSKSRILRHIPDGQSYSREVSDSRIRSLQCDVLSSQTGQQWCVTQVYPFGVQIQRKNPHGGAVPETRTGTGQAEEQQEQQPPWKYQPFPHVSPLHGGGDEDKAHL